MDYVMVPVPEEHLAEVQQFIAWNTARLPPELFDQVSVERYLETLDDQGRKLLVLVAEAAQDVTVLTVADAAEAIGCSAREVLGLTLVLNDAVRSSCGLQFVMVADGSGDVGPGAWKLNMPGDVAWRLLAALGRGTEIPS